MEYSDIRSVDTTIKRGRPKKNLDGELVRELVRKSVPLYKIAKILNCSRDTIYTCYSDYVKDGRKLYNEDCNKRPFKMD